MCPFRSSNNFKNLNRIKNRKEKRLKKKKDIFPIGWINIERQKRTKKIRTIFNLGNVSHDEVRITISPSSCHRFLSRHYLYPAEIGKDETNFHHNDGIFKRR